MDLKERVLNSEMYNSKDTLIIQNPPLSDRNGDIAGQVIEFLNHTFGSKLSKHDIKACHYLGKLGESAIIIKFIYFAHKTFLWRSKKALKGIQNPNNGRPIFLIERLPKVCRELQVEARNLGIKTVTNNCEVQVLCPKKEGNGVQFRPIHTMKVLELNKENALKFNPPSSIIGVRGTKRPEGKNHLVLDVRPRINRKQCNNSMMKTWLILSKNSSGKKVTHAEHTVCSQRKDRKRKL